MTLYNIVVVLNKLERNNAAKAEFFINDLHIIFVPLSPKLFTTLMLNI